MNAATVHLSTQHAIGVIDRRLFGGFLEHLGRAIYGGIYDPGHPLADSRGFRRDVIDALRRMRLSVIRYPGGNFVSGYDWRDGVGPKADRPVRPDFAWKSLETNQFGTDEFVDFCRDIGAEPMLAVNLGNGTAQRAAELVEYCNVPSATPYAEQRRANGHDQPHGIGLWCLGNEMDGPWQIGHCDAAEYARRALAASRAMKRVDPTIQTIAAGSCTDALPTYLEWDRQVLMACWDHVEYLSAHRYSHNRDGDTAWFLAEGVDIDRTIEDYAAAIRYVAGVRRSRKQIHICFDEWNVWYRAKGPMHEDGQWRKAPPLLEEHYNLEDALVCAQYLASFLRHADVVRIACIAQIVNVLAPILTSAAGLLIQPIYWPFVSFSHYAQGVSLRPAITCPTYDAHARGQVPVLDAAAAYDASAGTLALFLVNRSLDQPLRVDARLDGATVRDIMHAEQLAGRPDDTNTWDNPSAVTPQPAQATVDDPATIRTIIPPTGFATVVARIA